MTKDQRPKIEDKILGSVYKNNNGNYSRRVVPIHRLLPKLFTASDYCYSGRLHYRSYDLDLQPWAFRFCVLRQILPAVLLPRRSVFSGTKCHSGSGVFSRRIRQRFQDFAVPKLFDFLRPCDPVVERTFPVSSTC